MVRPIRLLACLALLGCLAVAQARELAVPASELVTVEVTGVGVDPLTGAPAVLLRHAESEQAVPIYVGLVEAEAVDRALRRIRPPRPLTHELMGDLLVATGAVLERLIIDELREGTYHAALELRLRDREGTVLLDTRPSDGMALALRNDAPIQVSRRVLRGQDELDRPRGRGPEVLTGGPRPSGPLPSIPRGRVLGGSSALAVQHPAGQREADAFEGAGCVNRHQFPLAAARE
jgi:bifunctional DNase/RNase